MMFRLCRLLVFALSMLYAISGQAVECSIAFYSQKNSSSDTRFVEQLKRDLAGVDIQHVDALSGDHCLVITSGKQALKSALSSPEAFNAPIIAVLISQTSYRQVLDNFDDNSSYPVTAVFSDPPLQAQIKLIESLLNKKPVKVAVLIGENNQFVEHELKAMRSTHTRFLFERIKKDDSLLPHLENIKDADVILATPDASLFNRNTIRPIVTTSYRYDQPIIGYSPQFVKAGALATVYTDIPIIVDKTVSFIDHFKAYGTLPESVYPDSVKLSFNHVIAKSLNIREPVEFENKVSNEFVQK